MADEANYKIDMLVQNLDKLRESVHALEVRLASFGKEAESILEKHKELHDKVETMWENGLKKEGLIQGMHTLFLKNSWVVPTLIVAIFLLFESGVVSKYFLK